MFFFLLKYDCAVLFKRKRRNHLLRARNKIVDVLFNRRYGTKCSGCMQGISPQDLVRKAKDKVFHLNCFTCLTCRKQLTTGEELYVLDDNKFICKQDFLSGKSLQAESHHSHSHHGKYISTSAKYMKSV